MYTLEYKITLERGKLQPDGTHTRYFTSYTTYEILGKADKPSSRWHLDLKTLSARCTGNLPLIGDFPHKEPAMRGFVVLCYYDFEQFCAGDLRRHEAFIVSL